MVCADEASVSRVGKYLGIPWGVEKESTCTHPKFMLPELYGEYRVSWISGCAVDMHLSECFLLTSRDLY